MIEAMLIKQTPEAPNSKERRARDLPLQVEGVESGSPNVLQGPEIVRIGFRCILEPSPTSRLVLVSMIGLLLIQLIIVQRIMVIFILNT